jgi:hypothetical protein
LREVRLSAIVIGNVAGVLQGAPVLTSDVDLLVRDAPAEREKVERLAERLDGTTYPILERPGERGWPGRFDGVRIHNPIVPVDVLFRVDGLTFEEARRNARRRQVAGQRLTVAALADVIRSKDASGREKDVAALPILRRTLAVRSALGRKRK